MNILEQLKSNTNSTAPNNYALSIDELTHSPQLSVLMLKTQETLNKSWHYEILFTSTDKQITTNSTLSQKASFTFEPQPIPALSRKISALIKITLPRTLHSVITEFS
jgi:uncharacterized protein involved in type VI secretion and phage assembly